MPKNAKVIDNTIVSSQTTEETEINPLDNEKILTNDLQKNVKKN